VRPARIALALDAGGVHRDVIVSDYAATGERVDAILARLLASPTYRDELAGGDPRAHDPHPEVMQRFFELVDAHLGGSVPWLSNHGLSGEDLNRLRRRLSARRAGAASC
jgi:hypothetical protein